jgi:hypothetical protein
MQTRTLKIQETADAYRLRFQGANSKPAIRLIGQWLQQAGFKAGDLVTVEVSTNQLVIRPKEG